jgi:hypothetical protein
MSLFEVRGCDLISFVSLQQQKNKEFIVILLFRFLLSIFIDALIIYVLFYFLEGLPRIEGIRESVAEEDISM